MTSRRRYVSIGMLSILIVNAVAILLITILQLAPLKLWVEWIDIYPAKSHFEVGEGLRFISYLDVHYAVDTEYNDIVRCRNGGVGESYIYHAAQASAHFNLEPSNGPYESPWKHNSILLYPDTCYLESNIKVTVFPGVVKYFTHKSEPFEIIPAVEK